MDSLPSVTFSLIGSGFCGTVWAPAGDEVSYALKREDGGPGRSLANDHEMHNRILASLDQLHQSKSLASEPYRIQIPRCFRFINASNTGWWSENLIGFPKGYSPCNVLQSERIPPLPQLIRERLIDKYCPPALIDKIKTSDSNRSCLVRPYLGRRRQGAERSEGTKRLQVFSLKNFPLHLDQMEQLDLPITSYAEIMADALAMMHWYSEIDANDVEFVLAPPRNFSTDATSSESLQPSSFLGEHTIWMLDFDCCRPMAMDDQGIAQAATAFFRNDPFYPRPGPNGSTDQALWEVFRLRYLQTSSHILSDDLQGLPLPKAFIRTIEEKKSATI